MKVTHFKCAADFRRWLMKHHATAKELQVGFHKKPSGRGSEPSRDTNVTPAQQVAVAMHATGNFIAIHLPMKINLFANDTDYLRLTAGQTVFQEGDRSEQMFAVIEGAVGILIRGIEVETVQAGGVFGEMALIEQRPRIATAVVKSDTKLVPIDRRRFEFLVQQNPFFALQIMTIMAERLRRMDEKL